MSEPTLLEAVDSGSWSGDELTTKWIFTGSDNYLAVYASLDFSLPAVATHPITGATMYREKRPTVEPVWADTASGDGEWRVTCRYIRPDCPEKQETPSEIGQVRLSGQISGASQHIVASLFCANAYGNGATTNDYGKLIAVGKDGPEGCDIDATVMSFTATKIFPGNALPSLGTLYALRGKTNNASFTVTDSVTGQSITVAAGECRLVGVSFAEGRADGGVPFAFEFAASPNRTGLSVGTITGIACDGWQYMWVKYENCEIGTTKTAGFKPRSVYIESVYWSGDYSGLSL
jgi:hypothetical protein